MGSEAVVMEEATVMGVGSEAAVMGVGWEEKVMQGSEKRVYRTQY